MTIKRKRKSRATAAILADIKEQAKEASQPIYAGYSYLMTDSEREAAVAWSAIFAALHG